MLETDNIPGKSDNEKLRYLNALTYGIVLKHKQGQYSLMIPELSLIASGKRLDEVYADLYSQKEAYFRKRLSCCAEDDIILPHKVVRRKEMLARLMMFTGQAAIFFFLFGVTMVCSVSVVANKVSRVASAEVARKVLHNLNSAAEQLLNIPEAEMKNRKENIRRLAESLSPLINAFREGVAPVEQGHDKNKK